MFGKKKNNNKICALVLAAGSGSRMSSDVKKQFIEIDGKPLIYYSVLAVSSSEMVKEIILITSSDDIIKMQDIVKDYDLSKVTKIVVGGASRQDSVYNGLSEISDEYDYVLIHDGARPLVETTDIDNTISDAFEYGAAALGVPVKDTIKRIDSNNFSCETLDRSTLIAIQTPQVIKKELLIKGYENTNEKMFTDDTSIVENIGVKVKITIGSYSNIKVTTPDDLIYLKGFDIK